MEERQNNLFQELENKTILREDFLKGQLRDLIVREEAHGKGRKTVNFSYHFY